MISVEKAKRLIASHTKPLGVETVNFAASYSRILGEHLKTVMDMPPFNRATVDGYAVQSHDVNRACPSKPISLRIVGTAFAGIPYNKRLKKSEAVKIMTGAVVPNGSDTVIMKELTQEQGGKVFVYKSVPKGDGIAFQGEDIKKGKTIIPKGVRINPGIFGLMAMMGKKQVKVYRKARVAILVTGNELISQKGPRKKGKIRSTNEFTLFHQIRLAGGEPIILGLARDDKKELARKIRQGMKADVLLISGGVSVGEHDFVQDVLRHEGARIIFWRVSVQPGKPLLFAKKKNTYIFGLPGNPVSTMVSFEVFVRVCLRRLMGDVKSHEKRAYAFLDEDVQLPPGRTKYVRGWCYLKNKRLCVTLPTHMGSGNLISMAKSNCFFVMPAQKGLIKKGTKVEIEYFPWD